MHNSARHPIKASKLSRCTHSAGHRRRPARRHRTHPALGPVLGRLGTHHLRRADGICRPHRPAHSPGGVGTAAVLEQVGTIYLIAACAIFYWASGLFGTRIAARRTIMTTPRRLVTPGKALGHNS
jgi:hypothetical protein